MKITEEQRAACDWLTKDAGWCFKLSWESTHSHLIVLDICKREGFWIHTDGAIYVMASNEYESHYQKWYRESEGQSFIEDL